jgi:hypothetical protein
MPDASGTGSVSATLRPPGGNKPDADGLCTLIAWLRVPLDRFTTDAPEERP